MTPQLMQAIKLLQLSNLDLTTFVEEELERNPLLERANDGPEAPVRGEGSDQNPEFSGSDEQGAYSEDGGGEAAGSAGESFEPSQFEPGQEEWMNRDLGSRAEIEQTLDTGLENVFSEEPAEAAARTAQDAAPTAYTEWGGGASSDEDYNLEAFVAAEVTLGDHLAEQLSVAFTGPAQRMIGQYLIDLVDEAGYLPADLGAGERLGATQAEIETVLATLQTFDPPGICARNLSECLAIQLRELNRYDPAMQALVENLDLLAKRDIAALRKLCGVDDEDITDMIGEIRRLDPKPGLLKKACQTPYVHEAYQAALLLIKQHQSTNFTPYLKMACAAGQLEMAKMLIGLGADFNNGEKGYTSLQEAARGGNLDLVKYLVEELKVDIEKKGNDWSGGTALYIAIDFGHDHIARYLMEKKASPESKDGYGVTVLELSSARGNLSLVESLVGLKVKVLGHSLQFSLSNGHLKVAQFLKENGARLLNNFFPPFIFAAESGNLNVFQYTVENKNVDFSTTVFMDKPIVCLLLSVAKGGNLDMLLYVLKKYNLNLQDYIHQTSTSYHSWVFNFPLKMHDCAATSGSISMLKYFFENGYLQTSDIPSILKECYNTRSIAYLHSLTTKIKMIKPFLKNITPQTWQD